MRKALKHYAAKEPSGLEWLGDIPSHWRVERAKSHLYAIDRRSNSGQEELLTVSSHRGVIPRRSANVTMFKAESYVGYKLCWPDDLVINSLWAWANGLGVSKYHGIISSAYGVYRLRNAGLMLPGFLHYLVRSSPFQWELQVRSRGIWTSRLQLTDERFLDTPLAIPPAEEQAAIVRYLDWACERLDRAIRAKRKIIALLNEQRQAIIHRAVTRGLDPKAPLKASGFPWLGEVPKHWNVMPLKHAFESMTYGISDPSTDEGTIRVLGMGHIRNGEIKVPEDGGVNSVDASLLLEAGDLLFNRTNSQALVGKVGIFRGHHSPVTFASYLVRLRPKPDFGSEYLNFVLNSPAILSVARQSSIPSLHQVNLNPTRYGRLAIALPDLDEQQLILRQLIDRCAPLDDAIQKADCSVSKIVEYRIRLIADVVTGKLDVREAAANLPAEVVQSTEIESDELESDEEEMAVAGQIDG
ncbi:MAG: restriction endonuclease subunit S [Terracidiphilus sp.]|jgi:type I restriction enzyme S subunit